MFNGVAAQLLQAGAIGVIPTDTLYGVVARAADQVAVERLYQLKHRERKPGTLIAATIDQLVELGIKRRYLTAVSQFWPGAVSVIIPTQLNYLTQEVGSLAIRIPDKATLTDLLKQTGPLITSSANQPNQPVASTISEAKQYFGDAVDFYVDVGNLTGQLPSTIIRVVDDAIEIIRQGAVTIKENE